MPSVDDSNLNPFVRLPGVDDAVDQFMDDMSIGEQEPAERQAMIQRAVAADDTFRFAIARRMQHEQREIMMIEREQRRIWERYQEVVHQHAARMHILEETLDEMARMWREAGRGNTMLVPGIGEWRTRAGGARWKLDNAAVMDALEGDEREVFIDPGEPRPPEPKLRGDLYRAHLLKVLTDSTAGRGKMTDEERDALAAGLAESYPGVEWEPRRIDVNFVPEGGSDDE